MQKSGNGERLYLAKSAKDAKNGNSKICSRKARQGRKERR
jgi:hypothetical protein